MRNGNLDIESSIVKGLVILDLDFPIVRAFFLGVNPSTVNVRACIVILIVFVLLGLARVSLLGVNAIYKKVLVIQYCRLGGCWVVFDENVKGGTKAIDSECVQCSQCNNKDKFFHIEEYKKSYLLKIK